VRKCVGGYELAGDRSQLHSDEGPPIGDVATEPWAEAASEIAAWVLRWN
jgi:hypothetical protein